MTADPSTYTNYNRSHNDYARSHRKNPTLTEKLMRNILRKDQLGVRFLRQKPLWPYIADFYCAKYQLVIEVDGLSHEGQEDYDEARDRYLSALGITTLRFSSKDVLMSGKTVEAAIRKCLGEQI